MVNEIQALNKKLTWTLVQPLLDRTQIIGYKTKLSSNRNIASYKARLVALSNKQKYSGDYFDTFSIVAKMLSIRILLSRALCTK